MTSQTYIGNELDLFAHATHWKRYYARRIGPRFGKRVLEVGAGLGETTRHLCSGSQQEWLCLEPDAAFCGSIQAKINSGELPACCSVRIGTTESLQEAGLRFDTILYVDVLEHIEDDGSELRRAARLLDHQGRIIVVSPAHDFLFSPFDRRIGHHRRYDKTSIRRACPGELKIEHMEYLDSVGMFLSLANRWLLRQSTPTLQQIAFWDKVVVPLSEFLDPVLLRRLGKSILAVLVQTERGANGHPESP